MRNPIIVCGLLVITGCFLTQMAQAQSGGKYDLTWSTIDNGGGNSSGGRFTITGTIGQSDAGVLAGGKYQLQGGFWSSVTLVQTPGAPLLKIRLLGNGLAQLSWPLTASGFNLEESPAANSLNWQPTPTPVHDTALEHTVTISAVQAMKCYRLRK